ncbi:MAG: damage-inducible protein, partial [Rhodobacteraceae bacterium]|nr:damage-inducible protein [Paracoccaceae bacterium]
AAGPSGNRYGDSAGHTCIAINGGYNRVFTLETNSDSREENMWQFASETLTLFKKVLSEAY